MPVFVVLVQCAKCGWQHTVWSGRHTQIGWLTRGFVDSWINGLVDSWIRGLWVCEFVDRRFVDSWSRDFVDSWIGKSVDLWFRGSREIRECLKITQISVSLLNRPQSHWSDEIEKQSATWKVRSVNGKLSQSILQFLTSATHSTCFLVPCAKCETCKWQINSVGRVFT